MSIVPTRWDPSGDRPSRQRVAIWRELRRHLKIGAERRDLTGTRRRCAAIRRTSGDQENS
jgi:hypothetical protein